MEKFAKKVAQDIVSHYHYGSNLLQNAVCSKGIEHQRVNWTILKRVKDLRMLADIILYHIMQMMKNLNIEVEVALSEEDIKVRHVPTALFACKLITTRVKFIVPHT